MDSFFENLTLPKDLAVLLEQVTVEKVLVYKADATIEIYIQSHHLLSHEQIQTLRVQIETERFAKTPYTVKIRQHYQLSEQYTPDNLVKLYQDSLVAELKASSMAAGSIIEQDKWNVDGEQLTLTGEDNLVARHKEAVIKRFLEECFRERFDCALSVKFAYTEPKRRSEAPIVYRPQPAPSLAVSAEKPREKTASKEPAPSQTAQAGDKGGYNKSKYRRTPTDPDLIYGRNVDGEMMPISEIQDAIGEVVIRGKIFQQETRELRNEKTLVSLAVTDFTDSIKLKLFLPNDQLPEVIDSLAIGKFIRVKGMVMFDKFDKELSISSVQGVKAIADFTESRTDNSEKKRVELHAHTMMSDMDAVVDVKALIKRAKAWGHHAVAITDHGVVQSFPEANHAVENDPDFKVIYGCEAYLVDDLKDIVENDCGQRLDAPCVVFDLETTGLGPLHDRIIEIGAVKVVGG